jgi:iron(III) transport system substrate-binding protein
VKLVGRGESILGLTDSDDIRAGEREGLPITAIPVDPEALRIPNTVAIIRGAQHHQQAERLFHYLSGEKVQAHLIEAGALDGGSFAANVSKADWDALARELEPATIALRQIFLR